MQEEMMNRLNSSDIIIALENKDGKLFTSRMAIYVKEDADFHKIGLLKRIDLEASSGNPLAQIVAEFSEEIPGMSKECKKVLKENFSLMKKKDCIVNRIKP